MRFAYPYLLLCIPVVLFLFFYRKKSGAIKFSRVSILRKTAKSKVHKIGRYLVLLSAILIIVALARPQIEKSILPIKEEGIDIAMVLDVSESMASVDFEPNRLAVAKDTIKAFIEKRYSDRLSFIIFSGNAYTRIPLTLDRDIINSSLDEVNTSMMQEKGTAIGMAISVGLNRLKDSDAETKIMILVTDGDNNAGAIDPHTASQLAKDLGIRIYTIGVGSDVTKLPYNYFGQTRYQVYEDGLNEELLMEIAETTDGQFYRAKDEAALETIFEEINKLEKSDFDQNDFMDYRELSYSLLKLGLILLLVGLFIDKYVYIKIP